jgi:hypothetical protein
MLLLYPDWLALSREDRQSPEMLNRVSKNSLHFEAHSLLIVGLCRNSGQSFNNPCCRSYFWWKFWVFLHFRCTIILSNLYGVCLVVLQKKFLRVTASSGYS